MINELKDLLNKLEELEKKADIINEAWEKDPENEELEKQFDEAYKEEFKIYNIFKEELKKLLNIDETTIKTMIGAHRNELKNILELA